MYSHRTKGRKVRSQLTIRTLLGLWTMSVPRKLLTRELTPKVAEAKVSSFATPTILRVTL